MKQSVHLPKIGAAALILATVLGSGGCGGPPIPRDLMMEEASKGGNVERPVAMRGEATFLDGKLAAVATVSRGFDRGRGGPGGPGGRGGRGRPGGPGGPDDSVFEDGGRRRKGDENAFADTYYVGGYGDSEEEQKEMIQDYLRQARARRAAGSPMPPVTLRVAFQNKGTEPLEIHVTEVNSDLGNFAVRPPKLTIAPGEQGTLEPMISQLGVTSDEIPLKLEIRYGGKKENQIVVVKNIIATSLRKEFEQLQK